MILTASKTLDDFIVETLAKKERRAEDIHREYFAAFRKVSLQAVYKALRKLCAEEVVLKHKEIYTLNNIWIEKLSSLFKNRQAISKLDEGESISYSFKSFEQLDRYWKHIQGGIDESAGTTYFFCPHQYWWFVPGRRESETRFYENFKKARSPVVLLIGSETPVDKRMRVLLSNPYVQVHATKSHSLKMTESLTVKGDIIIRTKLSGLVSRKIDEVFLKYSSEKDVEAGLTQLFRKKTPIKIVMEKNSRKSISLAKKISKYFFIPKTRVGRKDEGL